MIGDPSVNLGLQISNRSAHFDKLGTCSIDALSLKGARRQIQVFSGSFGVPHFCASFSETLIARYFGLGEGTN